MKQWLEYIEVFKEYPTSQYINFIA